MTNKEILVTLPTILQNFLHSFIQERVEGHGYTLNAIYNDEPLTKSELIKVIGNAAGYIVALETVDAEVLSAAENLKAISKYGVGTDNIDLQAAKNRDIAVSNCPGSNSNAVAELVIGLMITMARNTQTLCNNLRNKRWTVEVGFELAGKKVGILGFGNIGKRVARYLQPFEVEIMVYDVFQDHKAAEEYNARYTTVEEIAASADFITLHLPMIDATRHLLDQKLIATMKPGVFIVNAARGGIIDETALYEAVKAGTVAGAAVDVFEFEPPTASKLLEDERIIVLPHIGASTRQASINMISMAIDNVAAILQGKVNPNPVG